MSVTLADLIAEIEDFLSSHGADRDKECTLAVGINNSVTSLTVDDASLVDKGLIEIDYEMLAVKSKDNTTNVVTVQPWGRGARGTTAAVHSANVRVGVNPRFPRSRIRSEINTAIANLFPDLFAVGTDVSNTLNPAVVTYGIPATAEGVLKVAIKQIGSSATWLPTSGVRFDYTADTTSFPTGRTIDVLSGRGAVGQTIQVVYMKKFTDLTLDADTLSGTAGCDDSWRDLVTLQVCAKLVMALDPTQLQTGSMEQQGNSAGRQPGGATAVAKQLLSLYQLRLAQERSLLLQRYPARILHSN